MNPLLKLFTSSHIALYRMTGGRIGGRMMDRDVVLLTTTGRKSGKSRTTPLMSFMDGGRRFIIASAGGSPQHPAWFNNLTANPTVTVQSGAKVWKASAVVAEEGERARIYRQIASEMKNFAEYEKKAGSRAIPVVELRPDSA